MPAPPPTALPRLQTKDMTQFWHGWSTHQAGIYIVDEIGATAAPHPVQSGPLHMKDSEPATESIQSEACEPCEPCFTCLTVFGVEM